MKQIFTILSAMALTVAMNAQQLATRPQAKLTPVKAQRVEAKPMTQMKGYSANAVPFASSYAETVKDTTVDAAYYNPYMMYESFKIGYVGIGQLSFPYMDSIPFATFSEWPGKWTVAEFNGITGEGLPDWEKDAIILGEDTNFVYYPVDGYGWTYATPKLVMGDQTWINQEGQEYTVHFNDYIYGQGMGYYGESYKQSFLYSGYWETSLFTNCAMLTNDFTSDRTLGDRYRVEAASVGCKYCWGTDLTIADLGSGTIDTIDNVIPIMDGKSMWVDTIFLNCYNNATEDDVTKVMPDGSKLKITIYPIDIVKDSTTGELIRKFRRDSVMAEATAEPKNCIAENGGFSIQFVFKEKNPLGILDIKPAVLTQYCYAELTNFNESDCDFGIFSDYNNDITNDRTYFVKNSKLYSWHMNIDMVFNAYYPDIHMWDDTWINEVGAEGGVLTMGFLGIDKKGDTLEYVSDTLEFACNISTDFLDDADLYDAEGNAIDIKKSDLIADYEIITGPYTYEEGGEEYISLTAAITIEVKANPTENAREEVVYLQAYGAKQPIVIKQAAGTVGLHKVKAINDNKYYNIFGTEVNKNFKGIVIRNGIKSIQ